MHLKQPGFTYGACWPFTKNKKRIQKFKETGDASYIYKNELDQSCFQHDMAFDKVLRNKAFTLLKILNMISIKEDLLLWFIIFMIKSQKVVVLIYH